MQRPLPFDAVRPAPAAIQAPPEFVRHPRARRYIVRVRPDGSVRVSIPRWGSKREALAFAEQQQAWIDKQRARIAAEQSQQRDLLPARLLALAAQHGVAVSRVSVRNQRWRWGSCSRMGHICLNWRLVTMPDWVRDYVIIHELMHVKRMDHSPRFWKLVAAACPNYLDARAWLREHQDVLAN